MEKNDGKNKMPQLPNWILGLEEDELRFIKRFMLCSGSLKELAVQYKVTYPTLRLRLNRIIEKINLLDSEQEDDPFIKKIKLLAIDHRIETDAAKLLIREYRAQREGQDK